MMLRLVALTTFLALGVAACGTDADEAAVADPAAILVALPETARDAAHERIAQTATRLLTALTGESPRILWVKGDVDPADLAARHEAGLVVTLGFPTTLLDGAAPFLPLDPSDDRYVLQVSEATTPRVNTLDGTAGATIVALAAKGLLGEQYALYELCRRLGARFYHPEETFLPRIPDAQVRARARTPTAIGAGPVFTPSFAHRSFSFHAAHPLEQLESLSDGRVPIDEALRVNEWIVANRGDAMRGAGRGIAPAEDRQRRVDELAALRVLMGFRGTTGISLHNQQQGGKPDIDPTSAESAHDQIVRIVTERLAAVAAASSVIWAFGIHFGPTELTTTPEDETLAWLNWVGATVKALRPDLPVIINDHTSGSQPVATRSDLGCPPGTNDRGVSDYYDLAFHTDPGLGVQVHTVMFYPLEGPAPVYGQKSFAHKRCLMQHAVTQGRPMTWFPEGSYWLSFDNAVPVYLPLYIWTRSRDIALIRPMLVANGGTILSHNMFDSGHEWGYWQQDYGVGLWAWNSDLTLDAMLAELADPLCDPSAWPDACAARETYIAVLHEVMTQQRADFLDGVDFRGRPGGLYWYFAGEDPADEIGARTGLEFRPVRLAFRDVLALSALEAERLASVDLARLEVLDAAYAAWAQRLAALRADVPISGQPWLDEVVDGLTMNALRARHTAALYRVALALRSFATAVEPPPSPGGASTDPAVAASLVVARAALADAETVIARRERGYRYPPAQSYGGGVTPETALANGTTFPYRVHTKTHLLTYWKNRQQQIDDLVAGLAPADDVLALTPVFADPGVPIALTWPALSGLTGALDPGDATQVTVGTATHAYPADARIWRVQGALDIDGTPVPVAGAIARTPHRGVVASGGFHLVEPASEVASTVLASLVPALQLGLAGSDFAVVAEPKGVGTALFSDVAVSDAATTGEGPGSTYEAGPVTFVVPLPDPSTGFVTAQITLVDARFSGTLSASGDLTGTAVVQGELVLQDIVDALVALAGFDERGAVTTLAGLLGFDPNAPPQRLAFRANLDVTRP